jgi:uncharacterized protein with HEPN domain
VNETERDRDLLDHISESIDRIEEYRKHSGPMAEDAMLRRLETLADASGRLSEALRRRHPEIPWARVTAFRNVLAHGYLRVQRSRIDKIVEHDLPVLKRVVDQELRRVESP